MNAQTLPDLPTDTPPEDESTGPIGSSAPAFDQQVTDTEHRIHQLGPIIAEGGQGAVYRTTFAEVAVKRLKAEATTPELVETIRSVSRLPIRDLPIAMPYSATNEWPGYVMTMVHGMEPIGRLRKHAPRSLTTSLEWYARTGGLSRRIAVLARVADLLALLHGRGVVYGDLNPNNVLVSAEAREHEIWLIDTDNMKFADDPTGTPYTPGYAAPEHAAYPYTATFETDAYALLIVAFETLTGLRPFLDGRQVLKTRPGGQAERDAHQGLLPSIIDPQTSNPSDYWLIDRRHLLSPQLLQLFEQGFGIGRVDPQARPTASQLARALRETLDLLDECPSCRFTSWDTTGTCPMCAAPASEAPIVAVGRRLERPSPIWRGRVRASGVEVTRRALLLPPPSQRRRSELDAPALRMTPDREGVRLVALEGVDVGQRELMGEDVVEVTIDDRLRLDVWLESA